MKRYIILSVMLVLALGLNAQRTNTGSRSTSTTTGTSTSSEDEKKSSPENTETRTREVSPVKPSTNTEKREESPVRTTNPERKEEPTYNESRNRETPAVRTTTTTRKVETPAVEKRSSETNTRTVTTPRTNEQERTRNVSEGKQEPERKVRGSTSSARETRDRNSGSVRPDNRTRPVGNTREVNIERNREYIPRTEQVYVEKRQTYRTPERPRAVRTVNHSGNYVQHPVEYRKSYYPYAEPRRLEIIWDVNMYNEYRYLYPQYDYWYYPYGYSIHTISAYDADRYIGEIARIYGKVFEVWYERQTDEYTLYFGGPYPYQDFSVIVPGKYARRYSYRPERYFINRNIAVTGLVSLYDDRPEMLIRKRSQMEIYF